MSNKQRGLLVIFILVISTVMISACTQSLSSAPAATPTLIPPELFVSPFPSVENPMAMIEEFAKQTSVAQTTVANGGTPGTPQAVAAGTVITPQAGTTVIAPTVAAPSTPTNAVASTRLQPVTTPSGPTATACSRRCTPRNLYIAKW